MYESLDMWGASTVKYTTPVPCIGLSESDSDKI